MFGDGGRGLEPVFRIHMFLDLLDPDPLVRGTDPDPSIIMIPTACHILFYFLSLKNDVNVPSKSNKRKNLKLFSTLVKNAI